MNKPQGYLHSASEALFCLLIVGLPYYQSLFSTSITRVLLFCLLTFLFLFLARHSEDLAQAIRRCIFAICGGIILPQGRPSGISFVLPIRLIQDTFLTPFSKRPPPRLLESYV
jgi:hypothetical protein